MDMDWDTVKYIVENFTLNEFGQLKYKCVFSKNPVCILGSSGPNHCPKCNSTKCQEFITFKKSNDNEVNPEN